MHDLVIRGGTVVDGTGGPLVSGDVAVDAGVISRVGGDGASSTRATSWSHPAGSTYTRTPTDRPRGIRCSRRRAGTA